VGESVRLQALEEHPAALQDLRHLRVAGLQASDGRSRRDRDDPDAKQQGAWMHTSIRASAVPPIMTGARGG